MDRRICIPDVGTAYGRAGWGDEMRQGRQEGYRLDERTGELADSQTMDPEAG